MSRSRLGTSTRNARTTFGHGWKECGWRRTSPGLYTSPCGAYQVRAVRNPGRKPLWRAYHGTTLLGMTHVTVSSAVNAAQRHAATITTAKEGPCSS